MAGLFLPFTPNGKATELLAVEVKRRLGLGPEDAVRPFAILPSVPARLIEPSELWELCPDSARKLFVDETDGWSGIGFGQSPHDGVWLILLNPTNALTRRQATLMEEIVHIVRGHPKTTIARVGGVDTASRSFNNEIEDEAYSVGAACILPYPALFHAIQDAHETAASIARRTGVSVPYVEFRIRRAGLSNFYRKHSEPTVVRRAKQAR
jgi:Zn-dependent peptidase ImmA (M78 family)